MWEYLEPEAFWTSLFIEQGLSRDEARQQYQEQFVNDASGPLQRAIAFPFRPDEDNAFLEGRFNDRSYPALYSSKENETGASEFLFGILNRKKEKRKTVRIGAFSLKITGEFWNLLNCVPEVRNLLMNALDWTYPQTVGREARKDAQGLSAVSVRRQSGTNRVIFDQSVISLGVITDAAEYDLSMGALGDDLSKIYERRQQFSWK
jgi:RES domain